MRSFCSPLFPLVSQVKATADLVPAAQRGDLATVQDCLSKKANIETKLVRSMIACNVVSGMTCKLLFFIEGEHFEGCQLQRDSLIFSCMSFCLLKEVERITNECV